MNNTSASRSLPGTMFLRIAGLLYTEHAVSIVFESAVADFQNELRERKENWPAQFITRGRWSGALLLLLVTTPFLVSKSVGSDGGPLTRTIVGAGMFVALYSWPFGGAWSCVQQFLFAAWTAGSVLACAMRVWNNQHSLVASMHGRPVAWNQATTLPLGAAL